MSLLKPGEHEQLQIDLHKEIVSDPERGLRQFYELAWHINEPVREFIGGWHIDAMADHLMACFRRDIRKLIINVPPGSMKSMQCCVLWLPYIWTQQPHSRTIAASYGGNFARRDSLKTRRILDSKWYQQRWGDVWAKNPDEWGAIKFANDKGGFRLATSPSGQATGDHADFQVVDDPTKPMDIREGGQVAREALEKTLTWWKETMTTRIVDPRTSVRVIIMQRLHDADLAGAMLKEGGYEHLMLPAEYDPKRQCYIRATGFKDPRTKKGEMLWPERKPREELEQEKKDLGPRATAAQLQQNPVPDGGSIIKEDYVRYWKDYPRDSVKYIQSWDCAFKDLDDSDYVVGQVWAMRGGQYFLLDQIRDRMSVSGTMMAIMRMSRKWPQARQKLVEDKANGPAVMSLLEKDVPGLKPVSPKGGKEARMNAVEPLWAAGNVFLPDPTKPGYGWVDSFVDEVTRFGVADHDDQADAHTQALLELYNKTLETYKKAMDKLSGANSVRGGIAQWIGRL